MDELSFKQLMDANAAAFDAMGDLRKSALINANTKSLTSIVHNAFSHVATMGDMFIRGFPEEEQSLQTAFSYAYENAIYVAQQLDLLKSYGANDAAIEDVLSAETPNGLFQRVEFLPEEFETAESPTLAPVTTLHGLIRFLHQRSLDIAFDPKSINPNDEIISEVRVGNSKHYIIDLEDRGTRGKNFLTYETVTCKPLRAIMDFYSTGIPIIGRQVYRSFIRKNTLNAHIKINCHSADIKATIDGDNSSLSLRYNEYLNEEWRQRIVYLSKSMEYLGFRVDVANNSDDITNCSIKTNAIFARKTGPEKPIYASLTEMIRLLASSTDINCTFTHAKYISPQMLMQVFFEGNVTDLSCDIFDKISYEINDHKPLFSAPRSPELNEENYAIAEKEHLEKMRLCFLETGHLNSPTFQWIQALAPLDQLVEKRLKHLGIIEGVA